MRNPAIRPERSAHEMGLHLRCNLSRQWQGRGPCDARRRQPSYERTLKLISAEVARGTHVVIPLDQAGRHITPKLDVPDNITLTELPSHTPELNPTENIWQFMCENRLSNLVFTSYENIVTHCCEAWNELIEQPWRIRSIGMARFDSTGFEWGPIQPLLPNKPCGRCEWMIGGFPTASSRS